MSTPSLRKAVEAAGGTVRDSADGIAVSFPDAEPEAMQARADEIEAAVQRAKDFGTEVLLVWRERGTGWFVATSHQEHPGMVYLGQIDERTGQPIRCECISAHVCHHLGAAIRLWRERVGWDENEEAVLAPWRETLAAIQQPSRLQEEVW